MYLPPSPSIGRYGSVERQIGRRFDIVKRYVDWQPGLTFPDGPDQQLAGRHKRILDFSWNSINFHTHAGVSWQSIADGDWDRSEILPEARALKRFHQKVFLDFEHEYDSGIHDQFGTPAQFKAAYRHIHDVFRNAGVHNVIWTWVTTGYPPNLAKIKAGWPGAKYVDWVGYDAYNFATCHSGPQQSSSQTIAPFYHWLRRQPGMKRKPILLGEYASVLNSQAGEWYASVAKTLRHLPRIKAVMQWSAATSPACNFIVTDSAAALRGFRKSSLSAYILGRRH